jgi:predicted porin
MRSIFGVFFATGLLVAPAFAQSPTNNWTGLPDRFQVDAGYFRLNATTNLRYNSPLGGSGEANFEKDLGLDPNANTFWLDGTWRVGRRHQVKLAFTHLSRERGTYGLQRDFTWGGQTYNAGLSATPTSGTDILGGYYRFAIVRNDRFEIGPSVGVGYLWLSAGIKATGTVAGLSYTLDRSATKGAITGAIGAYAEAWPAKRLAVRGDFLYIAVSPGTAKQSVTDWRLGADYYFLRNVGVGVQYKYNRYSEETEIVSTDLSGKITYKGLQVLLSFLF